MTPIRPSISPFLVIVLPVLSILEHYDRQRVTVRIYFRTSVLHILAQHRDSKHESVLDAFTDSSNHTIISVGFRYEQTFFVGFLSEFEDRKAKIVRKSYKKSLFISICLANISKSSDHKILSTLNIKMNLKS